MIILDANYILRYLLDDNHAMFKKAKQTIHNEHCLVLNEVIAEVVYVLEGVYNVSKDVIAQTLSDFITLDNLDTNESKKHLLKALQLYQAKNLDFVDCILCALSEKYEIRTFDKTLMKCLSNT